MRIHVVLAVVAISLVSGQGLGQSKPKPKPKPKTPPKTTAPAPAPQQKPAVKGTTQLPGDNGSFDVTYTMGSGKDAYNLTIRSATFSVDPIVHNGGTLSANAQSKLLLFSITLANPNPEEMRLDPSFFRFTAYAANGDSYEQVGAINATDKEGLDSVLKPSQKVDAVVILSVPAKADIYKLMVQHWMEGQKVLRMDLKGKIKPLSPPYADMTATNLKEEIAGEMGKEYLMGTYGIKVDSFELLNGSFATHTPEEDQRILIVRISVHNPVKVELPFGPGWLDSYVETTDGEKFDTVMFASPSREADFAARPLVANETSSFRLVYLIPKESKIKRLKLSAYDFAGTASTPFYIELK
jgi:hypothetical protein